MEEKDLIDGEYYYSQNYNNTLNNNYILKYNKGGTACIYIPDITNKLSMYNFGNTGTFISRITRKATQQEAHWLETCIYHGTYISYEQAMLNFHEMYTIRKNQAQELESIYKKLLNL